MLLRAGQLAPSGQYWQPRNTPPLTFSNTAYKPALHELHWRVATIGV
jgi:hypothetical protein